MKKYEIVVRNTEDTVKGCDNIDTVCMKEYENVLELIESISKETKPTDKETLTNKMVKTFGDVELDGDEKAFLSLGPDFAMYEDFNKAKTETDFLIAATKMRWSRMGKPKEEVTYSIPIDEAELEEKIEEEI